jgi:dethiobiotin synthetase
MKGLFVTGTDTGVGKTTIAAGMVRALRRRGRHVRVCKPVATGAQCTDGRCISADTVTLAQAAGQENALDEVTPWVFPEPVAPPVAARFHGVTLEVEAMVQAVRRVDRPDAIVIVEGVGGLLCPIADKATVADLAIALQLPLIVVARRALGTLNHTLLTLEIARQRRLRVVGVVVNETEPCRDLAAETNVEELRRCIEVPLLAVVLFGADAASVLAGVEWERLTS